jgi:quercetin dioxygenase-like cupin family protein
MEKIGKAFIMAKAEAVPSTGAPDTVRIDEKGKIKTVKNVNKTLEISKMWQYIRPSSEVDNKLKGKQTSPHLWINLYEFQPGGAVDEHYREYNNTDKPVFEEALFVISGRLRAKVGDIERIVGPGTLIYFPSNTTVSFKNIGKGRKASYLKIGVSAEGKLQGKGVFFKVPTYTA